MLPNMQSTLNKSSPGSREVEGGCIHFLRQENKICSQQGAWRGYAWEDIRATEDEDADKLEYLQSIAEEIAYTLCLWNGAHR